MISNSKQAPKSCSCNQCKRGKHSEVGHALLRADERAFRHKAKTDLDQGKEEIQTAPKGNYYD